MAARKRTKARREADLLEIARRYVRGETQFEIARSLEISQAQVSTDLKEIYHRWRGEMAQHYDQRKAREIAKLEELERTYWRAWIESLKPREITMTKRSQGQSTEDAVKTEAMVRTEERDGNPAYLAGVMSCIDRRVKLLGLDEPAKVTLTIAREEAEKLAKQYDLDPAEVLAEAERLFKERVG